ncbi:ABC transporter permease [Streptomyces sp. NPDC047049]|uniref:ABC transporter permease n=1 Tax=Streptomyces sp. NPDC047049 TaxID=3156688 RepID=UPI0033C4E472
MTFWEYLGIRCQQLLVGAYQHVGAVFPCVVVATVLGVLIGVLTYRTEWAENLAITITASILTIPSLALLGLLVPVVGLGVAPAVIALTLYGLLPVVRDAAVGLRGAAPALGRARKVPSFARRAGLAASGALRSLRSLRLGSSQSHRMPSALARRRVVLVVGLRGRSRQRSERACLGAPPGVSWGSVASQAGLCGHGLVVPVLPFDAGYVLLGRLTISRGIRG